MLFGRPYSCGASKPRAINLVAGRPAARSAISWRSARRIQNYRSPDNCRISGGTDPVVSRSTQIRLSCASGTVARLGINEDPERFGLGQIIIL